MLHVNLRNNLHFCAPVLRFLSALGIAITYHIDIRPYQDLQGYLSVDVSSCENAVHVIPLIPSYTIITELPTPSRSAT